MLKFSAEWCGPCKAVAPIIDRLAGEFPQVHMVDVDIDRHQDIASQHNVTAVPTFVFFHNGKEIDRVRGGDTQRITQLLRELSQKQPLGEGHRVGSASGGGGKQPSLAELRELRERRLSGRGGGGGGDSANPEEKEAPRAPVRARARKLAPQQRANWTLWGLLEAIFFCVVLYIATLFSFDARARAATVAAKLRR